MKTTYIKELSEISPNNPVLIEGLPGLGLVGRLAIRYLVKNLKACRFAYLYSHHFPYFVLVNKKGNVRLLRGTFYFWRNEGGRNDLILFTGDSQSQTIEGQYEIADKMLDFSKKYKVHSIATIGGYRAETKEKPKVLVATTSERMLQAAISGKKENTNVYIRRALT